MTHTTMQFPQKPVNPPEPQEGKVAEVSSLYTQNEPERVAISAFLQLSIDTQSWGPHTADDFAKILQDRYGLTLQEYILVITHIVNQNRDESELFSFIDEGFVVTNLAQQYLQQDNAFWFVPEGKPVFTDSLSDKSWKTPVPPRYLPEANHSMIVSCLYLTIITLLVGVSVAVAAAQHVWRKMQGRS